MKCPECKFENREEAVFCGECGSSLQLEVICPNCGSKPPRGQKFCDKCGQGFGEVQEEEKAVPEAEGERKYVTVLFSDMTGYTALSEKLDPEEVKGITSRIFGEVSKVISKYDGFVEKYIGDAVVAIFGIPKAHEDDPVRALLAAREIHELVEAISPEYEARIGSPLSMHTGINTGLVVTGEMNMERGTHGVVGDTVNMASRFNAISKPGEIIVGQSIYNMAEGYFTFEPLGLKEVKGKEEPIQVYKAVTPKQRPSKIHRLQGVQAELIGRANEMALLTDAIERLKKGQPSVVSVCGDPGTGKSRLCREFKASLGHNEVQWFEGHAYAYTQNTPYSPLIDLLGWAFQIDEGDSPAVVRNKVESNVNALLGNGKEAVPYIGGLFSLEYPETKEVSPEFWQQQLHDAVKQIISALIQRGPTVVCLEDLHWADPSSIELLYSLITKFDEPVLFLCIYRPSFSLSEHGESAGYYQEIVLHDLSSSDAGMMLGSLLKTDNVPEELIAFVKEKAEGNPFYLEEMINSLIDVEVLTQDKEAHWHLSKPLGEADIPSTIHGVLAARLDRLEGDTKRILQEASVIGRTFMLKILGTITALKEQLSGCLLGLEKMDLIRKRAVEPDLEYLFKHALTQEVVYNGLLMKDRQAIHKSIGLVMEQLFQDRLPEFYETLAYHFTEGRSILKAVDYLMKSGEKSLNRFSIEESNQYYKKAHDLLNDKQDKTKEDNLLLIDILISWGSVHYYRGSFKEQIEIFKSHENTAESIEDKSRTAMFFAWLSLALNFRDQSEDSYLYLNKALKIGEEIGDHQVIGYSCTWLTWTCLSIGLVDEALAHGRRAQKIYRPHEHDPYIYFKSLCGLGTLHYLKGEAKKAVEYGSKAVEYGKTHSNIRSTVLGTWVMGFGYLADGAFSSAIDCCSKAIRISKDPFYSILPEYIIGMGYVLNGQFQEAESHLQKGISFSDQWGLELMGTLARPFLAILFLSTGQMAKGLKMLEELQKTANNKTALLVTEYCLGKVYQEIVVGSGPKLGLATMVQNAGFILKAAPFASKKAENHFNKAIEISKEIGAKGYLGMAWLDLGLLHKAKKRNNKGRECIAKAIRCFEECDSEIYLNQAKDNLASLE